MRKVFPPLSFKNDSYILNNAFLFKPYTAYIFQSACWLPVSIFKPHRLAAFLSRKTMVGKKEKRVLDSFH